MTSGLSVWRCESCGRCSFPRRELCPYCGSRTFAPERVDRGVATEVTNHRGVDIASVRIDEDVTLLARAGHGVVAGSEVAMREDGGAPVVALA